VREVDPARASRQPNFQDAQAQSDAVADTLRKAAGGGFERPDSQNGAAFIPNATGERPFVQLQLPDGRTLTLAQPEVAVGFILGRILGPQESSNPLSVGYAKALMYVAEIDGQPVRRPTNMAELQNLSNVIGDRNLDLVSMEFARYWPQMTELTVLKKNGVVG